MTRRTVASSLYTGKNTLRLSRRSPDAPSPFTGSPMALTPARVLPSVLMSPAPQTRTLRTTAPAQWRQSSPSMPGRDPVGCR